MRLGDRAGERGRAIERRVVADDKNPVTALVHIELDGSGTDLECALDREQRRGRRLSGAALMRVAKHTSLEPRIDHRNVLAPDAGSARFGAGRLS